MDAAWQIYFPDFPGDNAMVFDNYSLVAEENPEPRITFQPHDQSVVVGDPAAFSVVAGGEAPLFFQWSLNGKPIPGATGATLSIPAAGLAQAGTYTAAVSNAVGFVKSNPAKLTVTPQPAAPVFTRQPAGITVAQGSTALFTAKATGYPAPVYQWSFQNVPIPHATAAALQVKNVQLGGAYVVTASNALGVATSGTATLTVGNSFASLRGNYNGLIHGTNDPIGSGELKVAATAGGAFSGSLILDGRIFHLAGHFDAQGQWHGTIDGGRIAVQLQLALTGAAQVTGSILGSSGTLSVTAPRDNYSKSGNPAPQAGAYTAALSGTGAGLPEGLGYAALTVDAGGNVRAAGKLGDGTPFTAAGAVSDGGAWPFYATLYKSGGYIRGAATFEPVASPALDGTLFWYRPSGTGGTAYGAGFQGQVAVAGYHYTPPLKGSPAIPLNSQQRGVITFSGSVLSGGPLTGQVGLSASQALVAAAGGIPPFTLSLAPATGLFSGTVEAFNRKVPFSGALLQPLNGGSGLFQSPTVTGAVQITSPLKRAGSHGFEP